MPLQATSGAASYDAFGGGSAAVPNYIEDVFSTWLYTGNGATQTITNGIDLAGKGGLVWIKQRDAVRENLLFDTIRGATQRLYSNLTNAQSASAQSLTAFTSSGFSLGTSADVNNSGGTYVSWTFREQPKFFDVVTYTGTGANRTIAHNLGSVPGCIIVKRTNASAAWAVYHRSLANTQYMVLDSANGVNTGASFWNSATPTSTVFSLGNNSQVNASGGTYVAYIFAHNAGGFGLSGTDNVISCGSFTTDGSSNFTSVALGYEPQFMLFKSTVNAQNWVINDVMRGASETGGARLFPNTDGAEVSETPAIPTATGFKKGGSNLPASDTIIYIAIRRGPMKVPTTGTSVFSPNAVGVSAQGTVVTTIFPVDLQLAKANRSGSGPNYAQDRLRGVSTTTTDGGAALDTTSTAAENIGSSWTRAWSNTGFQVANQYALANNIYWNFRRAPGFFDVVCYTGTGANRAVTHNLGVAPELMIVKKRSAADDWGVYAGDNTDFLLLNTTAATADDNTYWNDTSPTSTVFSVGTNADVNTSAATYVAYLFATCAGVSKVGSYTGTGATQVINCGFTGGARFVMIKSVSAVGSWYVWDSARGIVAGNDPYLLLNSVAAEVTTTDWVDTAATGFELSNAGGNLANTNGVSYIFLAIA
jgi:hypothetical protein